MSQGNRMGEAGQSRKRLVQGVMLLGAVATIVLLALTGSDLKRKKKRPPPPGAPVGGMSVEQASGPEGHALVKPRGNGDPSQFVERTKEALEDYKRFAIYPPWSRPADRSQQHLIKWNPPATFGQAFTKSKAGNDISAEVTLDKMFAGQGETITATVRVWEGAFSDTARKPIEFKAWGEVRVFDPTVKRDDKVPSKRKKRGKSGQAGYAPEWIPVQKLKFDEASETNTRAATFIPSSIAALTERPRDVQLVTWVKAGGHTFPFAQPFRYAKQPPLVVLAKTSDAIVDGSLEIQFEVDVKMASSSLVQAILYDAAGKHAIAVYDAYFRPTKTGRQPLVITFFGRPIRERGINGPYSIRFVHGKVTVEEDGLGHDIFWRYDDAVTTTEYAAEEFSGDEWDSPEKDHKISLYEQMIKNAPRTAP